MPDADTRTQDGQYLHVADDQGAARELQRVLSLSSTSFYRCALRLLGLVLADFRGLQVIDKIDGGSPTMIRTVP